MNLFFIISKIGWWLVKPSSLVFILALIGLLLLLVKGQGKGWLATAAFLFVVTSSPLGVLPIAALEDGQTSCNLETSDVSQVVVLGGMIDASLSIKHQSLAIEGAGERLIKMLEVTQDTTANRQVLFSGGSIRALNTLSEGQLIGNWYEKTGLNTAKLRIEPRSLNTFQNAIFTRQTLGPTVRKIALVTSAFHMPRSRAIFENQGFNVMPCPVDFRFDWAEQATLFSPARNLDLLDTAAKEYVGTFVYWLTGRL